ncbi:hypothetical protein [Nitrosopumilus sp.]|uniref:hypothetical protein n=1 Tax=Nitrosopumilus sp. TaxID=2024843 RepID=UPI00261FC638|nr:hypothetical protein [Nitrosopumilus sp.]
MYLPKGFSKKRRAVSAVVTSGILLAAVAIIGTGAYTWSQTSIAVQKQEMEEMFSTQMNKLNEDLVIENVWFSTTCTQPGPSYVNCLNVTMSNVGTLGLNVTEMELVNGTTLESLTTFYYTDGGINPSGEFSTNATHPWKSGGDFDIIVYTERGNQYRTQAIAP